MLKDKYPVKRITRRRRIKKHYKDDNDSNRALEVEDEQDFDIFSDNKLFSLKSVEVPSPSAWSSRRNFIHDCSKPEKIDPFPHTRQRFPDLVQLCKEMKTSNMYNPSNHFPRITVQDYHKIAFSNSLNTLQKFQHKISNQELYVENDPIIDLLLKEMATMRVHMWLKIQQERS
ncbi:uncharacterized protein TNCT_398221 [Trichonephila clavata]|uniref:Uncharacterized protein n=1 Tax=Trichonephila clavata TaxID=2740835 RepID=A0A8X6KVI4_TRICU|nr:uncharacterized protein TNCT_398221 [Trichonephila clavata]